MRFGVVLILQTEQHEVSGVTGRETGHLQVVVHPAIRLRQWIVLAREKLLLIVVAGSPGQYRADVERLAQDLTHHILGQHAFRGVLIVRAAGCVDVMIAGKPADAWWVDPSLESNGELAGPGGVDAEFRRACHVLGPAARGDGVAAQRQPKTLAIGAIHLRLEGKVGREALRWVREDSAKRVAN